MVNISRRHLVVTGAAAAAWPILPACATPAECEAEIAAFTGGKPIEQGNMTIDLPEIAEDGSTVPLQVTIDSPMIADDYIAEMLVVADGNPRPSFARFKFTPLSGKATVATRIRLQASQHVIVVARTSSGGRFVADRKQIMVTVGGCTG